MKNGPLPLPVQGSPTAVGSPSPTAAARYAGQTVLVVGAARSGCAAAGFLLARSARVVLTDLRSEAELRPALDALHAAARRPDELVLELGGHRAESFACCDLVVVSPGVPASLPFLGESRARGIPVIAEVELAFRHLRGALLAITGSNGKTTTTTLVAEMLLASGCNARAAGNIGLPLIGYAAESQETDIYAVELSSFQLECIRDFRPKVAAVLNLTPDHLDRHSDFEDYVAAKKRIFMNQTEADSAVLNADDERAAAAASGLRPVCFFFSRRSEPGRGAFLRGSRAVYRDDRAESDLFDRGEILIRGVHNLENILAACAIAMQAGATVAGIGSVVRTFRGVEHRLERVAEVGGVEYFNDSKATNVDAAVKSLEAFPEKVLWIAGGRDKGGDFTRLRDLARRQVKLAVLIGEAAGKIREALGDAVECSVAASLPEAVEQCRQAAAPGEVVLLAPACASFDMFENYEDRGRVFRSAVRELQRHGL
jgi:UDP-N-acetylmuramoylalanine--D-glutamate ligase